MKKKGIIYRLSIYLILSVIIFFAATITIITFSSINNSSKGAQELAESKAKDISNQVKNYIDQASGNANALAKSFLVLQKGGNATREDLNNILIEILELNPNYLSTWTIWEPNTFDGKDDYYKTVPVYDKTDGLFNMCYYKINNEIVIEKDPGFDELDDFYYIPKTTKKHTILESYFYSYTKILGFIVECLRFFPFFPDIPRRVSMLLHY